MFCYVFCNNNGYTTNIMINNDNINMLSSILYSSLHNTIFNPFIYHMCTIPLSIYISINLSIIIFVVVNVTLSRPLTYVNRISNVGNATNERVKCR